MVIGPLTGKIIDERKLPEPIYGSVVRSLYADIQSLFIGVLCLVIAPLVIYWKTGDQYQLLFSALFLFSGMGRILLSQSFFSSINKETPIEEYQRWETLYFLAGCAFFALLGAWFLTCLLTSDDYTVYFLASSICLTFLTGVLGRNFGSDRLVLSQVLIMSVAMIAGLVVEGGLFNLLLAAFLIPYFASIRIMATRLRKMLFFSETTSEANRKIAERFNIALENVMHGIAMFDKTGKLVVANDRFVKLAGFDKWDVYGNTLSSVISHDQGSAELATLLASCLAQEKSSCFEFVTHDGKTIEADYNAMKDGGVVVLSDVSDRVQAEHVIRDLANFDPLTSLCNRRHFVEEATQMLRSVGSSGCAMFFVDLDQFKEVNDTLGHGVGDKLLTIIAKRLDALFGDAGIICRFGGDEFVALVPSMNLEQDCAELAQKIIDEVKVPVDIDGNTFGIGASVGIAIGPQNGDTVDELLQNTDSALYSAKAAGRAGYVFYTDELGEAIRMRRQLEADLRDALENNGIDVHFQPLIDLRRGKITTCEALVRWNHPELGRISPETFVRIAEEAGSINLLGNYVLKRAMRECKSWPDHVCVAVNVSSVQFQTSDMLQIVKDSLHETGLPPERLEIEITESVMLDNIGEVTKVLEDLSALGVKISLDDFGTGFSSLSYLQSLPFDKVKIDRSFIVNGVSDQRSLTLLKGVVDLIKNLGLSVVLEGVEDEEQMQILARNVEIDQVQGFLFSRPIPADDTLSLLQANQGTKSVTPEKAVA